MRKYFLLAIIFFGSMNALCQELSLVGPCAGIGILSDARDTKIKSGFHSAFGWRIELPYKSKDITGYGEGGFMLLGIDQGIFFPHGWGYFGIRGKEIGFGVGPVINPLGVGIGVNPYYQVVSDKLRIPIGLTIDFISGTQRYQLSVGFMYN